MGNSKLVMKAPIWLLDHQIRIPAGEPAQYSSEFNYSGKMRALPGETLPSGFPFMFIHHTKLFPLQYCPLYCLKHKYYRTMGRTTQESHFAGVPFKSEPACF